MSSSPEYDERGNLNEVALFGVDGKPTLHKDGLASPRSRYDERGNHIEVAFIGLEGKPILRKDGYPSPPPDTTSAATRSRGPISASTVAALHNDGYAMLGEIRPARQRDRGGLFRRGTASLAVQGRLRQLSAKYDERGNRTEASFFGVDGEPTRHKDGHPKFIRQVRRAWQPDRGRLYRRGWPAHPAQGRLRQAPQNTTSAATPPRGPTLESTASLSCYKEGYATHRQVRRARQPDRGGLFRRRQTAGAVQGRLPQFSAKYDERGNAIEEAYFVDDSQPALHKDGNPNSPPRYDERGNIIEPSFFGVDGKPTLHKDGHARFTKAKYDEQGN